MIEIIAYKPINSGKKIAAIDVFIPKMGIIYRNLYFLHKDGRRWVNFPKFSIEESGVPHFYAYVEFRHAPHNKEFLNQVHEALNAYIEKNKISLPAIDTNLDLSGHMSNQVPF